MGLFSKKEKLRDRDNLSQKSQSSPSVILDDDQQRIYHNFIEKLNNNETSIGDLKQFLEEKVKNGFDLGTKDKNGYTILHHLATIIPKTKLEYCEMEGIMQYVLNKKPELVNDQNDEGNTPLHLVLKYISDSESQYMCKYREWFVGCLAQKGADISIKNNDGDNVLDCTVNFNDLWAIFGILYCDKTQFFVKDKETLERNIHVTKKDGIPLFVMVLQGVAFHLAKGNKDNSKHLLDLCKLLETNGVNIVDSAANIDVQDKQRNHALRNIALLEKNDIIHFSCNLLSKITEKEDKIKYVTLLQKYLTEVRKDIDSNHIIRRTIEESDNIIREISSKLSIMLPGQNKETYNTLVNKLGCMKLQKQGLEDKVKSGFDLGTKDKNGYTILHHLATIIPKTKLECCEMEGIMQYVLNKKPELVNDQNDEGNTPLHLVLKYISDSESQYMCKYRKLFVGCLVQKGANIFIKNSDEENVLDRIQCISDLCAILSIACDDKKQCNMKDKETFKRNINITNKDNTLLPLGMVLQGAACYLANGNKDGRKYLLNLCKFLEANDANIVDSAANIDVQDKQRNHALRNIALLEKNDIIHFSYNLLSKITEKEDKIKYVTLLQKYLTEARKGINRRAIEESDNIIREISSKLSIMLPYQNEETYKDLIDRLKKGNLKTKDLIDKVKKSFDLGTKDKNGDTILHYLVRLAVEDKNIKGIIRYIENNHVASMKELVNTKNEGRDTPLHLLLQSQRKDKFEIFMLFMNSSADISIQNKDDNNALHLIALLDEEEKVQYLDIILGATSKKNEILNKSTNAKNNQNRTPIQAAIIEQGNNVQSQQKSFFQKLCTDTRYLKGKTQHTVDFCVKLLLRTDQQNKAVHLNLPVECNNPASQHILTEIYNRTSERHIKKNMDSNVKLLFAGLISATIFSAVSGYMIIAAGLSMSIAVCAAYYVISASISSVPPPGSNRSQDMNPSLTNQSENLKEPFNLSTALSCVSLVKAIKGIVNYSRTID